MNLKEKITKLVNTYTKKYMLKQFFLLILTLKLRLI